MKRVPHIALAALTLLLILPASPQGREDTARLTFRKSFSTAPKVNAYRIRSGDTLSTIVARTYGADTYRGKLPYFKQILRLNPDLKNINRIYPGQLVLIPSPEPSVYRDTQRAEERAIRAQKGDTLYKILRRELNVPEEALPRALEALRRINPGIGNPDRILPGQGIRLPASDPDPAGRAAPADDRIQETAAPPSTSSPEVLPADRTTALRDVITRLKGTVTTTGHYYLPLPDAGQITIDCAVTPVVELPDGCVVFLDRNGRVPESVKKTVRQHWKTHSWVRFREEDPLPVVLQGILRSSSAFAMKQNTRILSVGDGLKISIRPDWMITRQPASGARPLAWALCTDLGREDLLPAAIRLYLERVGLPVIELLGNGQTAVPQRALPPPADVQILKSSDAMDLLQSLCTALGLRTRRNAPVQVFSPAEDGFNLEVEGDLLVEWNGRTWMFRSKKLPEEFAVALRKKDIHYAPLPAGAGKVATVTQALGFMQIPYSTGLFSLFRSPEDGPGRITVQLTALKIEAGRQTLYLTESEIDPRLYGWLNDVRKVRIIRF